MEVGGKVIHGIIEGTKYVDPMMQGVAVKINRNAALDPQQLQVPGKLLQRTPLIFIRCLQQVFSRLPKNATSSDDKSF